MPHPYPRLAALAATLLFATAAAQAQDGDELLQQMSAEQPATRVVNTFHGLWLVNLPSNETTLKGDLAFDMAHLFGDAGGPDGKGFEDLWGLDFVRDYRLAMNYGITDRWTVGIGRTKLNARWDVNSRVKILLQEVQGMPVSLTAHVVVGIASERNTTEFLTGREYYPEFRDRLDAMLALSIARKFGRLSFTLVPMYLRRERVVYPQDNTDIFALGIGGRLLLGSRFALTADYTQPLSAYRLDKPNDVNPFEYIPPLGFGFEVTAGGHVFSLVTTNNQAILPNKYLADSRYDWLEGRWRFGFRLMRVIGTRKKDTPPPSLPAYGD